MEFSGQYLTYEEYRTLGGTLDLTSFNLLEFESRRKIDIITQNRLKNISSNDLPQEVKLCIYKMINSISNYNKTINNVFDKGNVASENIDGYSVSYTTTKEASEIAKSKNAELDDIMREYLINVIVDGQHIMYLGVDK